VIKSVFGAKLRRTRQAAGLTQDELADMAMIKLEFLNEMEAGENQPNLSTLFQLSKALNTTPEVLILPAWTEYK
jgi:transcriptional regulator with XRE-family HTH domain